MAADAHCKLNLKLLLINNLGAKFHKARPAVVLSDCGQEVHLPTGAAISRTPTEPVTIRARIGEANVSD